MLVEIQLGGRLTYPIVTVPMIAGGERGEGVSTSYLVKSSGENPLASSLLTYDRRKWRVEPHDKDKRENNG